MALKHYILFWAIFLLLFIGGLYLLNDILLPFVVALVMAYFLDPLADILEEWKLSRGLASILIVGVFFTLAITTITLLMPVLYKQSLAFLNSVPHYTNIAYGKLVPYLTPFVDQVKENHIEDATKAIGASSGTLLAIVGKIAKNLLQSGAAILNLLALLFITPVVMFYILRDYDRIITRVDNWLPRYAADTIRQQMRLIDNAISGYIRGQTNVCILLGIFYAIALSLAGLQFGLLIGLATGILSFIPYAGMLFGFASGMLVAFIQFDGDIMYLSLIASIFLIGQVIEGNFITPKLVGDKVGLHPVWIIFGMLAGGTLLGFTGVLLAIPVTAVIGVLTRFALQRYTSSTLYKGTKST